MAKKAKIRELEGSAPRSSEKAELKAASEKAIMYLTGKETVEEALLELGWEDGHKGKMQSVCSRSGALQRTWQRSLLKTGGWAMASQCTRCELQRKRRSK